MAQDTTWVDLGLPSGTLWMDQDVWTRDTTLYTYDEAVARYGNQMPTVFQMSELIYGCQWLWQGDHHKVVGPNGNSIHLSALGFFLCDGSFHSKGGLGAYWTSTAIASAAKARCLLFDSLNISSPEAGAVCCKMSVNLVKPAEDSVRVDTVIKYKTNTVREIKYINCNEEAEEDEDIDDTIVKDTTWVDLGLPSGTLWRDRNEEGYYDYYTALLKFDRVGIPLPTKVQFEELIQYCTWTWYGNGYEVVGPNGNSIYLPAVRNRNCNDHIKVSGEEYAYYWSSTGGMIAENGNCIGAYFLNMDAEEVFVDENAVCGGTQIRLAKMKDTVWVDLGLPSGMLWRSHNERGYYTHEEACEKYGPMLPDKNDFEELQEYCTWTWTGCGYKVVGPNGASIVLPAAGGTQDCDMTGSIAMMGVSGTYCSASSSEDEVGSACFFAIEEGLTDRACITGDVLAMIPSNMCIGSSVRLVKPKSMMGLACREWKPAPKEKTNTDCWVDLGLPSGTLWACQVEEGYYTYYEAVKKYGSQLPTKKEMEELRLLCKWDTREDRCIVTGPNGNSIVLPIGIVKSKDRAFTDTYSMYWTSTQEGSNANAFALCYTSEIVSMAYERMRWCSSVLLVKN
jgi:hypothetical protein